MILTREAEAGSVPTAEKQACPLIVLCVNGDGIFRVSAKHCDEDSEAAGTDVAQASKGGLIHYSSQ